MTVAFSEPTLLAHFGDPWYVAELLARPQTVCDGHYRLLSGQHADRYVRFSSLARDGEALRRIGVLLGDVVAPLGITAVLAPSTAGVALGVELSRYLGARLTLVTVDDAGRPTELLGGRGLDSDHVLVVNDVISTGQGIRALADLARTAGADVVAGAAFLSRRSHDDPPVADFPIALVATLPLPSWDQEACPMCSHDEPWADGRDLN